MLIWRNEKSETIDSLESDYDVDKKQGTGVSRKKTGVDPAEKL